MFDIEVEEGPSLPSIIMHLKKGNVAIGQFLLVPSTPNLYEVHVSPIDRLERGYAVDFARYGLKMVFEQMVHVKKIFAMVPVYNRLAIKLAKESGMKHEGFLKESFLYDGKMIDQELFGISKEDVLKGVS